MTPGIGAPLRLASAQALDWDAEADIVIVGFGGAGVAAALEGLERGASVIALDRFDGGGATAYSGGIVYAGGTAQQHEAGCEDNPEEMAKYLAQEGVPVSSATLERFCRDSAANLAWTAAHGVPYASTLYTGKITYPPEGKFLYYSGNEKNPQRAAKAKPAPRGHRAVGKGFTGSTYYARLREAALRLGARVIPHAPVRRLIMDAAGNVLGVEADQLPEAAQPMHRKLYARVNPYIPLNGKRAERAIAACARFEREAGARPLRVRARKGVVLCAGGFIFNLALLAQYRPELAASYNALMRMGSMGCDGSGIELGLSAGGEAALMESVFVGRSLSPPEAFLRGILVNREGRRFINEDAYIGDAGQAIARQPGGSAWLVLDARMFWRGVKDVLLLGRGRFLLWGLPVLINILLGGTRRAGTARVLARRCGGDAAGLEASIAAYNAAQAQGAPDPQGKQATNTAAIAAGPLYAIDVSVHNRFGATSAFTLGGLRVAEDSGAVLGKDGRAIPGLYAAGRTALGVCSSAYFSGMSIADTLFSGRRAARAAAEKDAEKSL